MVFHWQKHNMTVTVTHENRLESIVQLALGSEVRTLQLAEFTTFLLSIIEEGRKATTAYLESLGAPFPRDIRATELVASLARNGFVRKHPSRESVSKRRNAQEPNGQ